jgi:hypothetical protein
LITNTQIFNDGSRSFDSATPCHERTAVTSRVSELDKVYVGDEHARWATHTGN